MLEEKLSYCETARKFEVSSDTSIRDWERLYLTEGPECITVERRGRGSKGRLLKQLLMKCRKICWQKRSVFARRMNT